jgi:hypothetical protein
MEKPLRNVTDCHGCSPQRARSTDAVEDAPRRAGLADRNVCPAFHAQELTTKWRRRFRLRTDF